MPNQLPVSRLVRTSVNLSPAGAQAQSLSNLLIIGTSGILDTVERYRTYSSITDVATDFGTSAEEYKAALLWFGQSPQPTKVIIGRWLNAAAKGGLRCGPMTAAQQAMANFTAVTTGAIKYSKDGGVAAAITGINLSGAANLNAVAALITAALTGVTCVWNPLYARFEFTSATTGATSNVSFATAAGVGTDLGPLINAFAGAGGYSFNGAALETASAAVSLFDDIIGQLWYGLIVPSGTDADKLAIAALVEAFTNKHYFGVTTQDALTLVASDTTCLAYQLKQLGYLRTMVQYSSTSAYAVVSALARILTTDYSTATSVITLKFKQEPGVAPEQLSTTQANAVEAKNANVFVAFDNSTNILEQGVSVSGEFIDTVMGTDWLAIDIQNRVFNMLYTTPTKVPQTDGGVGLLLTAVEASCSQGVLNGLLAPGVWNSDGFGTLKQGDFMQKGYYAWALPINLQNPTDRAARKAPPIKVAAKLAGAIHSADISIVVNR